MDLILVGIVLAIFVFLFCKRKKAEEPKEPTEITTTLMKKPSKNFINKTQLGPKPLFLDFLKFSGFMYKDAKMPAMELTGEEFIVEIVSNPFFSGNYEKLLRDFVNLGDG